MLKSHDAIDWSLRCHVTCSCFLWARQGIWRFTVVCPSVRHRLTIIDISYQQFTLKPPRVVSSPGRETGWSGVPEI